MPQPAPEVVDRIQELLDLYPSLSDRFVRHLLTSLHNKGLASIDSIYDEARSLVGEQPIFREAEDDPNVILDEAEQTIFSIAEDRARQGFVSMRQIVDESLPKIEQLFEQKKLITGVPTGFVDLDGMTRGLQPGDLVIVAARPFLIACVQL